MKKSPTTIQEGTRFPAPSFPDCPSLPQVGVGPERWIFKSLLTKFFHDHFLWPDEFVPPDEAAPDPGHDLPILLLAIGRLKADGTMNGAVERLFRFDFLYLEPMQNFQ